MAGDMSGLSRLGNQPYQGPMPFQMQGGTLPTAAATGVSGVGSANPFASQGFDSFNPSFGGMIPSMGSMSPASISPSMNMGMMGGMGTSAISGSTLQLMAQINTMMASVMQGLMSFVQTLMASAQSRASSGATASTPGTGTSQGTDSSEGTTGTMAAPGDQAESAVQWALDEEKKGISEANNQDYISKNYSKGKVEAWHFPTTPKIKSLTLYPTEIKSPRPLTHNARTAPRQSQHHAKETFLICLKPDSTTLP